MAQSLPLGYYFTIKITFQPLCLCAYECVCMCACAHTAASIDQATMPVSSLVLYFIFAIQLDWFSVCGMIFRAVLLSLECVSLLST